MAVIGALYLLLLGSSALFTRLTENSFLAKLPGRCGDEWPPPKHLDPEVFQTIQEVIRDKGFAVEDHTATTKDGYILGMQRIPPAAGTEKQKHPVLLVHGLLDSSFTWVSNLRNQSLGYQLSLAGYDVWLGNVRGNTYSKRHVHLSPKQLDFWRFSWDQMAEFDVPAMVDKVVDETGSRQIYYVGHSQGTEIALAAFSENRTLEQMIKGAALLAPVATIGHIESPIKYVAPIATSLAEAFDLFGHGEFLPSSRLLRFLSLAVCGDSLSPLCSSVVFMFCGFDCKYTNVTRLPVYLSHTPAGTSAMNMVHYAQGVQHKLFQKYDFGKSENLIKYGQAQPPQYNISNVSVPLALYHAHNDWLADPRDFKWLTDTLGAAVHRTRNYTDYNHLDFVWGYNAVDRVYHDVMQFFTTL